MILQAPHMETERCYLVKRKSFAFSNSRQPVWDGKPVRWKSCKFIQMDPTKVSVDKKALVQNDPQKAGFLSHADTCFWTSGNCHHTENNTLKWDRPASGFDLVYLEQTSVNVDEWVQSHTHLATAGLGEGVADAAIDRGNREHVSTPRWLILAATECATSKNGNSRLSRTGGLPGSGSCPHESCSNILNFLACFAFFPITLCLWIPGKVLVKWWALLDSEAWCI